VSDKCGSVAPSCDWVCEEPRNHSGRHGLKKDNMSASWPNLPELNQIIAKQAARIAELESELKDVSERHINARQLVLKAISVLEDVY
jgi:hypothetical protein